MGEVTMARQAAGRAEAAPRNPHHKTQYDACLGEQVSSGAR
jgi:hypothetical protein